MENRSMELAKRGRKWLVVGSGDGWVFHKTFPTKWKAKVAMEVFAKGGRVSDYWKEARVQCEKYGRPGPWRVMQRLTKSLEKIQQLKPTCKEILAFGPQSVRGVVTYTESDRYFAPKLHNTLGFKSGGRVHIDIGCGGCHLMLDKNNAEEFIKFIRAMRQTSS
jgi:hypothetical protein